MAGLAGLLLGCTLTPAFDPTAYQTAVSLKYETLALIDKGSRSYKGHRSEAEALANKFGDAHTASAQTANNLLVEQQWNLIRDPEGKSAGAVLAMWKKRGALSSSYRNEKRRQVSRDFDYLICLETSKQSPADCNKPASGETVQAAQAEAREPPATPTPKPKPAASEASAAPAAAEEKTQ